MSRAQTLVDTQRYPIAAPDSPAGQALIARCRAELQSHALCVLGGFVRASVVRRLAEEAETLVPIAYRFDEPRGAYDDSERGWPAGHPRMIRHPNRYLQVLNHQLSNDSPLRQLFLWPRLTEFVRRVLGYEALYTSACPHLALTIHIGHQGDCNGWHYDSNSGIATLVLQESDSGGALEWVPNLRTEEDEHYDEVLALWARPDGRVRRRRLVAGTFTIFNGRHTMHRLSAIGPTERPRIVAIFSYDRRPDKLFSQAYIDRVRSFRQGLRAVG
jgi:hypothetical protein